MSCEGCMFAGRNAGCDFSYPCNTSGRPVAKKVSAEGKPKKEYKAKKNITTKEVKEI